MSEQLDAGLAVRVLDATGTTVGVGALVGPQHILTCAHVVNAALGRDHRAQDQPMDEIIVDFAGGDGPPLRARIQRWLPPPRAGATGDDIAGLVLTSVELPLGACPARLAANPPARDRVAELEDFSEEQIRQFLTRHYGGNTEAAVAQFELLGDVRDLLGLSRNPRMLSFIADLDEQRLRAVQRRHGQISAAGLYRELVDFWLVREAGRHQHRSGLPTLDDKERLAACTALAQRLWSATAVTIPEVELAAEVGATLTRLVERGYTVDQAAHTVGSGTLLVRTPEGAFTFVHQSVMEWLVANAAAEKLRQGEVAEALAQRTMSTLMLDFLCDLAGHEAARRWAGEMLADPDVSQTAKQNALAIGQRLGPGERQEQELAGMDLRSQNLTDRDLRGANLHGADLRGMRLPRADLAGADLREADLTGVRMTGGNLAGAQVSGSRWNRAALLGVSGLDELLAAPELAVAAIPGRDRAEVMLAAGGPVSGVAFSPDGGLLATARGHSVEIIDRASGDTLRVLHGHTDWVRGVTFSPDGALLASAANDRTVRLWDPTTGVLRATLLALDEGGHAVLLPDGAYKLDGDPGRSLWWAIKLCRFAPGELDDHDPAIRRLPADALILH